MIETRKFSAMATSIVTLLFSILLSVPRMSAQDEPEIPQFGMGLSGGYFAGTFNDQDIDGLLFNVRLATAFNTYPITFAAVDAKFLFPSLETSGASVDATGFGIGPLAGLMIPFDLFFDVPADQPRGIGLPVYVGYNIVDNLKLDDADESIEAQSLKVGVQLPVPIDNLPVFFALQTEFVTYFFDDEDETVTAFAGADPERTDWNFMLQVGIPFD